MKKTILTLLLVLTTGLAMLATVPVRRVIAHTQPDGTTLQVNVEADGYYTTYTTADGTSLLREKDGHYYYARISNGDLTSTGILAHEPAQRNASENAGLALWRTDKAEAATVLSTLNPRPTLTRTARSAASTTDGLGSYGTSGMGEVNTIGDATIPVVMVDFADKAFQDTIDAVKLGRMFNEEGYHDEQGSKGSVRDYFLAQSQGMFRPKFDVVAHVTLSQGYAYYGADSSNGSIDPKALTMVREVLSLASQTVDFTPYKVGSDVPLVAIVFAGPGQQSSFEDGHSDYLWAKHQRTSGLTVNDGKIKVDAYFLGNELLQNYGTHENDIRSANLDGIGLFCHEFGHALGLPDFYYTGSNSTTYSQLLTLGYWDIMDYGQYYWNGYAPPGYTAYERSFCGWLRTTELTDATFATLYPFGQEDKGATAYVLRNPENEKEYYILENRQPSTWYPKRMGSGMLITHIDYDAAAWSNNTVNNNTDKQRMSIVPADNIKDGRSDQSSLSGTDYWNGYKGDLFPGTTGATSFTDDTTPAATLFEGTTGKLGKPLYNIALSDDGVISFSYLDPKMTGIRSAKSSEAAIEAYTLQGVRVGALTDAPRGVYILSNGKKYIKR